MAGVLVVLVLAGTALVFVGARLIVRREPGTRGAALLLVGALVVIIGASPMLDHLYPAESPTATLTQQPSAAPPTMDMGGHAHPPSESAEASPSPTEAESPSPAATPTEAPAASPAAPSPTKAARRTTSRTAPRRTGATAAAPAPAPPPAPAPAPEPPPEPPAPPASPAPSEAPSPPPAPPSPEPTPPPSPSPPAPTPTLVVTVTCSGLHSKMQHGDHFTMTYDIDSATARKVGLGAALIDPARHDRADGSGDKDSVAIVPGHTTVSRQVNIPSDLRQQTFEAVGQVWPEHHIGDRTVAVIAQDSCGSFELTN